MQTFIHLFTSNKKLLSVFLLIFQFGYIAAQTENDPSTGNPTPKEENIIEQRIEQVAENNEDTEIDYTNLVEQLYYFIKNPINLNSASREELLSLNLLTDIQINNLLQHIKKNGRLITIYELQSIDGFELDDIQKILPYIRVTDNFETPHLSWSEMQKYGQHSVLMRYTRNLEKQLGYSPISDSLLAEKPNSRYLGDPNRVFLRYRFNYSNNISWGVTGEKDAGEQFFKGVNKNGFDFYSAHAFIRNFGKIKAVAIGDYLAQFGQGLTYWGGQAFGKSPDPMMIKRSARGISPYASINEALYLRGAAVAVEVAPKIVTTAFFSRRKIDANSSLVDTTDNFVQEISSLQISGFHRTPNEVADKNVITQQVMGGNVSYKGNQLQLGGTFVAQEYSAELNKNLQVYNQFDFTGRKNWVGGVDYNYIWRNVNLFGESSRSANGGLATQNGAIVSLDPRFAVSFLYRNYQRNFQPVLSNAINESTFNINEKGLMAGFVLKPKNYLSIAGYFDRFAFPWLRSSTVSPSYGFDYLAQLNYTPSKKLDMYIRYRHRVKQENTSAEIPTIDYLENTTQERFRFNATYTVSPSVKFRNRVEIAGFTKGKANRELGYLVYQDIVYKAIGSKVSFSFRYSLFQCETFDTRIYAYENSVLYAFSIPGLSGKGSRTYLTVNWDVARNVELWLRVAQTYYYDRDVISEGSLEEIQKPHKTEFIGQVRFKF
ncbi:MAG: helix-hairpin-helix domain-containing protein [Bacteroidota bacterium]